MIYGFKIDDGYQVEYSTRPLGDVIRLDTVDGPRKELFEAVNDLVRTALAHFGLADMGVYFRQVKITDGDEPKSKIELNVACRNAEKRARLQLPTVSRREVVDAVTDEPAEFDTRNIYNRALNQFIEEAQEYVRGKRQQMSFDFEDEKNFALAGKVDMITGKDGEGSVVDGARKVAALRTRGIA
jgi:hypothetical protein